MPDPARPGAPRVLLVEDDEVIGEATQLHLERHDYAVTWVRDGLAAWQDFRRAAGPSSGESAGVPYDVVLTDVMLPELDGVSLCRRIREMATVPIVIVSARTDSLDVVAGLEAGADDYVTKPFDVQVLLARLRSVLRRAERLAPAAVPEAPEGSAEGTIEHYGDLELDRAALDLRRDGRPVVLTPTEMRLFLELADAAGRVLSRGQLLERVWDYADDDDPHLVNVHVQRLRAKIGAERIETVRGFGYKLRR